ncbi:MAG TPA: TerC family protein [Spongiibacteraceae bacterium]|nr:TerC family protein [Spongiibacteraceae bacterium]
MEWLSDPQAWAALATLTALEIVLGIDNIIFLSILVGRLPKEQQQSARLLGLSLAMLTRILLLLSLTWVMGLTEPILTIMSHHLSGRDLILLGGGLFLLWKSTAEIHESLEGDSESETSSSPRKAAYLATLVQIALIDIVFSLDSVITAVGMVKQLTVMVIAIILAVAVMMFAAKTINDFIERHPSLKMLALSFLMVVGVTLVSEGMGIEVPKGYIYFAMAFSLAVEVLNIRHRTRRNAVVQLRKREPREVD